MFQSLRLVLFGPPGAGKGTQAQLLKDQLQLAHISSGDLFRYHLRQGTLLGQQVSGYINQGQLVPDEVTINVILDKVMSMSSNEGFMLDGFPRNTRQAEALEQALASEARKLDKVIYINVPEDELIKRLSGRYTCRQCSAPHTLSGNETAETRQCDRCGGELYQREDDQPAAVQQRIKVYQQETLPVLDFYRQRNLLADIPGVGSVEKVNQSILAALGRS